MKKKLRSYQNNLGHEDKQIYLNVTQANLINGFCKGLANSMDDNKLGTQLCYIADKLDSKSHKVLKELVAFIELKHKP